MAAIPSSKSSKLTPTKLTTETYAAIGKLIRAFAEIEDLIKLYICNLAEINESRVTILLGRSPISSKLAMAFYLAKMTGNSVAGIHKEVFNGIFSDALKCRNAVAHGVLMGITDEGRLAFLTADTADPIGPSAVQVVISYLPRDIITYAEASEAALPLIEKKLKLSTLRRSRLGRSLSPHRASQSKSKNSKQHRGQPGT